MQYLPKLGGWSPDSLMQTARREEDYSFSDSIGTVKAFPLSSQKSNVVDLRKWCSPVEDQGQVGSCVGNSVVGALELLNIKSGAKHVDLSRLFIYYNSRLMHRCEDRDEGTYIRLAMGTLSSLGTCTESKWSYDPNKVNSRPSWGSYREAYAHKIGSFYCIKESGTELIDMIKAALSSGHPVVFGMIVDDDYMNYRGGVVPLPRDDRQNPGGHAQLIVGYDEPQRVFIVRNSWGSSWGVGGYAYVPFDYLDRSDADDFWVPTALIEE